MKFQTLTSTLVLSFLLTGSHVLAMDSPEEMDANNTAVSKSGLVQPQVADEALLLASTRRPDLIEQLAGAREAKNVNEIKRITNLLVQEALENPVTETPKQETWNFAWSFRWLFGKSEEKTTEPLSSAAPPPPATLDQEETLVVTTLVNPDGQDIKEAAGSAQFSILNPSTWGTLWRAAPSNTNPPEGDVKLNVSGQNISINPDSVIEPPINPETATPQSSEETEQK